MKNTIQAKKHISRIILILLTLLLCFGDVPIAHADTAANAFDDTYVMSDLAGAVIDGKTFNVKDFPANAKGEERLITFSEYSFSTNVEHQDYFGLYLYFYNPTGKQILDHQLNTVEMAVTYNGDTPTVYRKFRLKLLSYTTEKTIYKFKIEDTADVFNRVALTPDLRRYDLSGIEVFYSGATNAKDCTIGGTWKFSGYAKGCHTSSMDASTLQSVSKEFKVAEINDLQFTYYRTWKSAEWAEQLTSVYFSVDKTLVDQFDSLYSIQAEAYKYLTSPIFCIYTKNVLGISGWLVNYDNLYDTLYSQRGRAMNGDGKWLGWDTRVVYNKSILPAVAYNNDVSTIEFTFDKLAWVLPVEAKTDFTVSSSELLRYMTSYSETYGKTIQGKYSADLFADKYYSYTAGLPTFESGYLPLDITCDDSFTLMGSNRKAKWWNALGFTRDWDNEATQNMRPIEVVTTTDLNKMTDKEVEEKYYICSNDVKTFRDTVKARTLENRATYLFHFDVSDYYTDNVSTPWGGAGYMAQEAVYLDFDIISLGYSKDNSITTVPAVCSPIDIIAAAENGNGTATGKDDPINWIKILLMIIGLLLLIMFIGWLVRKIKQLKK
jgi:hypothetical protein